MPTFRSFAELKRRLLEEEIKEAMNDVVSIVAKELHDYIEREVYVENALTHDRQYKPSSYRRTYEFIDSIVVKKAKVMGNEVIAEVRIDTDKMNSFVRPSDFNARLNIDRATNSYGGDSISTWLWRWVDNGVGSSIYNPYGWEGIKYTEYISDWLNKHFATLLAQRLKITKK